MTSLLNAARPPVFCPGCSHERITRVLDEAYRGLGLSGNQIAMVSDIGCSGLFDTFFETHAFHGLHGRALTYAAGIKLARPELTVVVTMGDGGQGIGGAHLLSACRRNLDLTLLVLNNFNFGMTGGQYSATTPAQARVGSGFLNRLEQPLDICRIAASAGAPYVKRCSAYQDGLAAEIQRAIEYGGFAVVDLWGICPGRYSRHNRLTPKMIDEQLAAMPPADGPVPENRRAEYGRRYRELAAEQPPATEPLSVACEAPDPEAGRQEIVLLGSAGQRIITAGELLCLAGLGGGLNCTQKNEYNITVLRGPSISEVILSPEPIDYTGIQRPSVIIAVGQEGVDRRRAMLENLGREAVIIHEAGIQLPSTGARRWKVDLKTHKIKRSDWALAGLVTLAGMNTVVRRTHLVDALQHRFKARTLEGVLELVDRIEAINSAA
jgi:pyruvate/2-oxoacid:ferredoxin oxidoreductase beta subunit/Pyruvate/2-oxoacid:ferredoxin oxidoreductase gamma subunit